MQHVDDRAIAAFLDGEAPDSECAFVEEHLLECEACARDFEAAAQAHALSARLVGDLSEGAERPAFEELVRRAQAADDRGAPVQGRAVDEAARVRRPLHAERVRALAWAATVAVAFLLGWQTNRLSAPAMVSGPMLAPADSAESDAAFRLEPAESTAEAELAEEQMRVADAGEAFVPSDADDRVAALEQAPEARRRAQRLDESAAVADAPARSVAAPAPAASSAAEPAQRQAAAAPAPPPALENAVPPALGVAAERDRFAAVAAPSEQPVAFDVGDRLAWLGAESRTLRGAELLTRSIVPWPATAAAGGSRMALRDVFELEDGRQVELLQVPSVAVPGARADAPASRGAAVPDRPTPMFYDAAAASLTWRDPVDGLTLILRAALPELQLRELVERVEIAGR